VKGALCSVKPEAVTVSPFIFLSNPNQIKTKKSKQNQIGID